MTENEQDAMDDLKRRMRLARELLLSTQVQMRIHLLGPVGQQDIDDAVAILTDRQPKEAR